MHLFVIAVTGHRCAIAAIIQDTFKDRSQYAARHPPGIVTAKTDLDIWESEIGIGKNSDDFPVDSNTQRLNVRAILKTTLSTNPLQQLRAIWDYKF